LELNQKLRILLLSIYQKKENMFVDERFLDGVTKEYDKHQVSIDGGA
jgi:hypothetical protein